MAIEAGDIGGAILGNSFGSVSNNIWIYLVVIMGVIFLTIGYYVFQGMKFGNKWNKKIFLYREDPVNKRFQLRPHIVKARQVILKNGLHVMLLEVPINNKRLMPFLNYYTKPGEYDIGLTSDNRIFIFTGIDGIDEERKLLKVGVRYPGIDQDFDLLNHEFKELNKSDKASTLLDLVKQGLLGLLIVSVLIGFIVGTNQFIEYKKLDTTQSELEVRHTQELQQLSTINIENNNAMRLLVDELKTFLETENLQQNLQNLNNKGT